MPGQTNKTQTVDVTYTAQDPTGPPQDAIVPSMVATEASSLSQAQSTSSVVEFAAAIISGEESARAAAMVSSKVSDIPEQKEVRCEDTGTERRRSTEQCAEIVPVPALRLATSTSEVVQNPEVVEAAMVDGAEIDPVPAFSETSTSEVVQNPEVVEETVAIVDGAENTASGIDCGCWPINWRDLLRRYLLCSDRLGNILLSKYCIFLWIILGLISVSAVVMVGMYWYRCPKLENLRVLVLSLGIAGIVLCATLCYWRISSMIYRERLMGDLIVCLIALSGGTTFVLFMTGAFVLILTKTTMTIDFDNGLSPDFCDYTFYKYSEYMIYATSIPLIPLSIMLGPFLYRCYYHRD